MAEELAVSWSVPLPSERYAEIAKRTMDVDEEYNSDIIERTIEVEGNQLKVNYRTK